jgi:hypothetical protein
MIYNPTNYLKIRDNLNEILNKLLQTKRTKQINLSSENAQIVYKELLSYYNLIIRDKDNIVSIYLTFILEKLNIKTVAQNGGNGGNGNNEYPNYKLLNNIFYTDNDKLNDDEILINNLLASMLKSIIIEKNSLLIQDTNNSKYATTIFLTKPISVYGGYRKTKLKIKTNKKTPKKLIDDNNFW